MARRPKVTSLVKLAVLIVFVAGAVYFFRFTDTGRSLTAQRAIDEIEEFHPAAARLIYVGGYVLGTVLLVPGTLLSFAGAVLFGAYEGTLYTWVGAVIGSVLAFLLAKALGRDFVNELLGCRFEAFDRRIREQGFYGLLVIRLVPLFPFNGVNFGCGLTGMRLWDYTAATAIGIVPGTFVYQYLFAKFGRKILTDGFRWEYLADPELLTALGLFVTFIVFGKWLSGRLQKRPDGPGPLPPGASA
jgi:uncharacterized membrane protein YdjX (TVP38/TMEM64 family)